MWVSIFIGNTQRSHSGIRSIGCLLPGADMNAMNGIARRTYALGWLFFLVAVVERIMLTKESVAAWATMHAVLPRNFLELSFLFFVITIASRACCAPDKA
jgi:hypothetical protein